MAALRLRLLAATLAVTLAATLAAAAQLPPEMRQIMLPKRPIGGGKTDFSALTMNFVPTPTVPPEPALAAGQLLLRVHASSVNPCDVVLARSLTEPRALGSDVAGVVVAVGPGCSSPIAKVGAQVWGLLNSASDPCPMTWPADASCLAAGAWADYAVASENMLNAKPEPLSMTEAATLPLVGLTSYQALQLAGAPWAEGSNKTVVITSGAGGTGFVAVQLAKAFFARRVVTAAAPQQIPWVKSLGADVVVVQFFVVLFGHSLGLFIASFEVD